MRGRAVVLSASRTEANDKAEFEMSCLFRHPIWFVHGIMVLVNLIHTQGLYFQTYAHCA